MKLKALLLTPLIVFADGSFTAAQYKDALTMSTRFFGAQRSGHGPNWLLMDSEFPKSFVRDSLDGRDLTGGWFDCGDHVMFGQTQFYASYVLAKSYQLFPEGFPDVYSGDYSGYQAKNNFSVNEGTPNGLPDVLDELEYQADFLVKIMPNPETFYSQKGEGGPDHKHWVTSGKMSTLPQFQGGEADKGREIVKNPQDAMMSALASATLAVLAQVHPDASKRAKYLQHAKYGHEYALNHPGIQGATPFYSAQWFGDWEDAMINSASELFKATGDSTYYDFAIDRMGYSKLNVYYRFDYSNDEALAYYNLEFDLGVDPKYDHRNVTTFLEDFESSVNSEGVVTHYANSFASRSSIGAAWLRAAINKGNGNENSLQFVYDQVDYWLGDNNAKQSFLVGFEENGATSPKHPHHRNVFGITDEFSVDRLTYEIPARNAQLGALLGGTTNSSAFRDYIDDYSESEPCLDTNAPFVGVLAYLNSLLSPVTPVTINDPVGPFKLTIDGSSGGAVSIVDEKAEYASGDTVIVVATPAENFRLFKWIGNSETTDTLKVVMDQDQYLYGQFVVASGNRIQNGDFSSDLDYWEDLKELDGANGSQRVTNGVYDGRVSDGVDDVMSLIMSQKNFYLEKGEKYEVSFRARAPEGEKEILVYLTKPELKSPFSMREKVELSLEFSDYYLTFEYEGESDEKAELNFLFGGPNLNIEIDDVVLQEWDSTNVAPTFESPVQKAWRIVDNKLLLEQGTTNVELYNSSGVKVLEGFNAESGLDISELQEGHYFLKINDQFESYPILLK